MYYEVYILWYLLRLLSRCSLFIASWLIEIDLLFIRAGQYLAN